MNRRSLLRFAATAAFATTAAHSLARQGQPLQLREVQPRQPDNGLALAMKIAVNLSLAVQMLAFSEGVLLAEKSGIPREVAVDVLVHSAVASPMIQYRGPFVLKQPDEAWFG